MVFLIRMKNFNFKKEAKTGNEGPLSIMTSGVSIEKKCFQNQGISKDVIL